MTVPFQSKTRTPPQFPTLTPVETVTSLEGWLTKTKPKKEAAGSCSGIASSRSFQKQVKTFKKDFCLFYPNINFWEQICHLGRHTKHSFKPVKPCLGGGHRSGHSMQRKRSAQRWAARRPGRQSWGLGSSLPGVRPSGSWSRCSHPHPRGGHSP